MKIIDYQLATHSKLQVCISGIATLEVGVYNIMRDKIECGTYLIKDVGPGYHYGWLQHSIDNYPQFSYRFIK